MFKYDDRFSIDSDKYQWLLHDYTKGQNRKGEPTVNDRLSFHANLKQVADTIVDRSAKPCLDLLEIVETLIELEDKLDRYFEQEIKIGD